MNAGFVYGGLGLFLCFSATATTRYVDVNNPSPASPYTSWTTAATNIQLAVDVAAAGDVVLVTNGIYATGGRAFSGTLTFNRVWVAKQMTVQSVNGPAVTIIRGVIPTNDYPAIRCVWLTNGASLVGFTLEGGGARNGSGFQDSYGAGVYCTGYGALVSNCIIRSNLAYDYGSAAYWGTLRNCLVINNPGINNPYTRYAVYGANLINCTVVSNQVMGYATVGFSHCTNCIILYNHTNNYDGGIYSHCCTVPLPTGSSDNIANITGPPGFVDPAAGDMHLQTNSLCINAGESIPNFVSSDLDGLPRISGGQIDVGAYEFQNPASRISYAWLQTYGLVSDAFVDSADADDDGYDNWHEWISGTIPTNSASVLRILSLRNSGAGIQVSWPPIPGKIYRVERAADLGSLSAFFVVASNLTSTTFATKTYLDTNAVGQGPFLYRVGVGN